MRAPRQPSVLRAARGARAHRVHARGVLKDRAGLRRAPVGQHERVRQRVEPQGVVPLPVHRRVRQRQRRQVALLQQRGAQVAEQPLARRRLLLAEAVVNRRPHARASHLARHVLAEEDEILRVPPHAERVACKHQVGHHRKQRPHEAAHQRRAGQRGGGPGVAGARHEHKPAGLEQRRKALQQVRQALKRVCKRARRQRIGSKRRAARATHRESQQDSATQGRTESSRTRR